MKTENKYASSDIAGRKNSHKTDREAGRVNKLISESFSGFGRLYIKSLLAPSSLVLIPVLIVFAAVGKWAEALATVAAFALYMLVLSFLGAVADKIFDTVSADFSDGIRNDVGKAHKGFASAYAAFCRIGSVALLVFSAAVLLLLLIFGNTGFENVLSVFITSTAFSLILCGPQNKNILSFISAVRVWELAYPSDRRKVPVAFLSDGAVSAVAESGTCVIVDGEVLYDKRTEVRGVWFDGQGYSGINLRSSALRLPAEKALLVCAAYSNAADVYPGYIRRTSDALSDFADFLIPDPSVFLSDIADLHLLNHHPRTDAVTLRITGMSDLSGTSVISGVPSGEFSVCNAYRSADGRIQPVSDAIKKNLTAFFGKTAEAGLSPFIIYSNVNTHGRLSGDTILEAAFAVGGDFPENFVDAGSAMNEFGIFTSLWLPRADRESVAFAFNSGFVKDRSSVFIAGRDDAAATAEKHGRPRVFLGDADKMPVTDDPFAFRAGSAAPEICDNYIAVSGGEEKPSSDAAAVITPADSRRQSGGLISLFELMSSASEITLKKFLAVSVLLWAAVSGLVSFVLPLVFSEAASAPVPFAVLSAQLFSVLFIVAVLAYDSPIPGNTVRGLSAASIPGIFVSAAVSGVISGLSVFLGAVLAGEVAPLYYFSAYLLSCATALTASRIVADIHFGYSGFGIRTAAACFTALLIAAFLPVIFSSAFGLKLSGVGTALKSVLFSLIPAAVSFGAAFGTDWFFFQKLVAKMRKKHRK